MDADISEGPYFESSHQSSSHSQLVSFVTVNLHGDNPDAPDQRLWNPKESSRRILRSF